MQRRGKPFTPRKIYTLDVGRLKALNLELSTRKFPPDKAYGDVERGWVIQIWYNATPLADGTPWEGSIRVAVKHCSATTLEEYERGNKGIPISWDELQAIKDRFWPNRIGIEIYPPHEKIINVAEMRWLWILPPGASLPFNLGHTEIPLVSK